MKTVREACVPRDEVLKDELVDASFAAKFAQVVAGNAPAVYGNPEVFFRNTHPAASLKKVVQTVFSRLANGAEAGAAIRLSTGFGGGKTHTLIALWHLARNISKLSLGTELLPAAGRPPEVVVAGLDFSEYGGQVVNAHGGIQTHSMWGELAYQLGGEALYRRIEAFDKPHNTPPASVLRELLPDKPTLIMLDELVMYMAQMDDQAEGAALAFLGMLVSETTVRSQFVVVVTDTAGQGVYEEEASKIATQMRQVEAAEHLDSFIGRQATDFDPIGGETAEIIARRLFSSIDVSAAQECSAAYYSLYQRVLSEDAQAIPATAGTKAYADEIVRCYPFHPALLATTKSKLGAMQDFQRSRGTLRFFARLVREVWEREQDVYLISAGELDWTSSRIQAELLGRLNRDPFRAAVTADIQTHAAELDATYQTDMHTRVASSLLLESLPTKDAGMRKSELALTVLRPSDVGHEPSEALDRLMGICWHTYHDSTGARYEFRYEPNVIKLIEERSANVSLEDALTGVRTLAQNYYSGHVFALVAYPTSPKSVRDDANIQLVLSLDEALAQRVCDYVDDSDAEQPIPRRFRNAILAIVPDRSMLNEAVQSVRRLRAANDIQQEERLKLPRRHSTSPVLEQLNELVPTYNNSVRQQTLRAFTRVLFSGSRPAILSEAYLVNEESALADINGQHKLKAFLDDKKLVYQPGESLDVGYVLTNLLPGATPSVDHPGAYTASSLHERALSHKGLKLFMNDAPVRGAVLKGVDAGQLVVRQPDGDVYDDKGCVAGPEGARRRYERKLPGLHLDSDVLIAPIDAPCVASWLHVDPPPDDGGGGGEPPLLTLSAAAATKHTQVAVVVEALDTGTIDGQMRDGERMVIHNSRFTNWHPQGPGPITVMSWDEALVAANTRPLLRLTLSTSDPALVKRLIPVAQLMDAQMLTWDVSASGELEGGSQLNFGVTQLPFSNSLKPADEAVRLLRYTTEASRYLSATLALSFGTGMMESGPRLERARSASTEGIQIVATFGPPSSATGD